MLFYNVLFFFEISLLPGGFIGGRVYREFNPNEGVILSFKPHFLYHTRPEREWFYKCSHTKCNCKHCSMPPRTETIVKRIMKEIFQFFNCFFIG